MKEWTSKINKAKKKLEDKHREWAKKAESHFYNDKEDIELPLYHSMVQVQRSALYAKPPQPEIRGRNADVINPVAREVSKVLEKCINYNIDQSDFHSNAKRGVLDYLVCDLGVARVRLETKNVPQTDETGRPYLDETGKPMLEVGSQTVILDHWPWKHFIYDIGKDWEECEWICYVHHLSNKEVIAEYGVSLNADKDESDKTHTIYEVWDKKRREVIHMKEGRGKPLKVQRDPLQLKGFYDCHKPMISNMRSAEYIPASEFKMIHRQLEIVNALEKRIDSLTKTIKDVGFYDKSAEQLKQLEKANDGQLIPVDNLRQLLGTDGVKSFDAIVAKLPIVNQAQVVQILEGQKKDAKEQIYEITGLSDIIRGATKATETATAQQIKGQWASIRLQEKQSTINDWLKGIIRIMAEVIAEHFQPQQIALTTGVDLTPEMIQMMQSDVMRCYSIDIETDSTIMADEQQDKADRMEMLNTLLPLLQNIVPLVQQNQMPMDLGKTLLITAVKGFKYARGLEDMINGLGDNMQQLQGLQQQIQQMQQQMQQGQQHYEGQLQQAGAQIQQLQGQLQQIDMQEKQLEAMDTQAEIAKDEADTRKKHAEAQKIEIENATAFNPMGGMTVYG